MSEIVDDARKEAWEQEKNLGKTGEALVLALTVTGCLDAANGAVICPKCRKVAPLEKKFKIFPDGGWKHFSSGGCFGDAHSVMTEAGYSFPDAVKFLAGKPTKAKIDRPKEMPNINVEKFEATRDLEVFQGVLVYGAKTGGVEAACEFYSQWHISPEAVRESRAVMITDIKHFESAITQRFGAERLIASGLFADTVKGPRSLVSANFPIVEPHLEPGNAWPLYMQFRAGAEQMARYLAHKKDPANHKYAEKFLSMRGAPRASQIGMGLPRISQLPEGSTVYVVEGFKDLLAARTLGVEAYAVPGVDFRPNANVVSMLAKHNVVVTLDGDEAGSAQRDKMAEYLRERGVETSTYQVKNGFDIADSLVAKHAAAGCGCKECQAVAVRLDAEAEKANA